MNGPPESLSSVDGVTPLVRLLAGASSSGRHSRQDDVGAARRRPRRRPLASWCSRYRRVAERERAVVVLAEGAGQAHVPDVSRGLDASGNLKFKDIGSFLRKRISEDFDRAGMDLNSRYFDPSYSIRSVPANPYDSVYCLRLAHAAVHAGMAGRTATVVGRYHGRLVHLPMSLIVSDRNQVDPNGDLWLSVLEATDQPAHIGDDPTPAEAPATATTHDKTAARTGPVAV